MEAGRAAGGDVREGGGKLYKETAQLLTVSITRLSANGSRENCRRGCRGGRRQTVQGHGSASHCELLYIRNFLCWPVETTRTIGWDVGERRAWQERAIMILYNFCPIPFLIMKLNMLKLNQRCSANCTRTPHSFSMSVLSVQNEYQLYNVICNSCTSTVKLCISN